MFYLTENEFAFCRIKEKSGVIFTLLSGPSHILHSIWGRFYSYDDSNTHMSFVLSRASSSLWASSSSSAPSARRRRRNTRGGLKTLTMMVSASSSDVTDDDDAKEAATTVVVNEGNDENDDNNNNNDNNPFLGAAEEIGVIEWPTAGKALQTTGVVIVGIVLSSVFLLVVNEALSALSGKIFS